MTQSVRDTLIVRIREFLGEHGITHFRQYKEKYGTVSPIYMEQGDIKIPHVTHFREGMQVRNFLRGTGLCEGWTAHDYDDNWVSLVEEAIAEKGS